jgi:hypothetical protein
VRYPPHVVVESDGFEVVVTASSKDMMQRVQIAARNLELDLIAESAAPEPVAVTG